VWASAGIGWSRSFGGQSFDRRLTGLAVLPGVDRLAERVAGRPQRGEGLIRRQQVGVGRHEVGLSDLDGALRTALALWIGRLAGDDLEPVMATRGDELGMTDGNPGDPVDGDGPLVVGQGVGRRAAEPAERLVEAGDHCRQRPIVGRDDDAEPAPGQPGAPQQRDAATDPRSLAPVELEPHAGFRDPRPIDAPVAGGVGALGTSDCAPARPLGPLEALGQQLVVDDVGADLAVGTLDPLLDLGQEAVDQAVTGGSLGQDPARGPEPDVARDRVVRAAGELGRGPIAAG
jgi:hypothetical protein